MIGASADRSVEPGQDLRGLLRLIRMHRMQHTCCPERIMRNCIRPGHAVNHEESRFVQVDCALLYRDGGFELLYRDWHSRCSGDQHCATCSWAVRRNHRTRFNGY